ncbi:hypothetical protein V6N13_108592 [Hibiscus sabdariffa]
MICDSGDPPSLSLYIYVLFLVRLKSDTSGLSYFLLQLNTQIGFLVHLSIHEPIGVAVLSLAIPSLILNSKFYSHC